GIWTRERHSGVPAGRHRPRRRATARPAGRPPGPAAIDAAADLPPDDGARPRSWLPAGVERDQRDRPQQRMARAPEGAAPPPVGGTADRTGHGRRRRYGARRTGAVGPHRDARQPAGDAAPGQEQVRPRPPRRARRGTRGDRGGRGGAGAPVGCVGRLRPGRQQLRSGTSRPHSGCAGDPDRRKALHRDGSQSSARRRHRQPQATAGDRPGSRRGHPATVPRQRAAPLV
ncbi:MAG: Putative pre-16S rRNA nuclease Yqg, partial [uncultured Blastococcus sp.]